LGVAAVFALRWAAPDGLDGAFFSAFLFGGVFFVFFFFVLEIHRFLFAPNVVADRVSAAALRSMTTSSGRGLKSVRKRLLEAVWRA
jgi:hypothetical protein